MALLRLSGYLICLFLIFFSGYGLVGGIRFLDYYSMFLGGIWLLAGIFGIFIINIDSQKHIKKSEEEGGD